MDDPNYGAIVAIILAIIASPGLWEVIKLKIMKKSEPEEKLDNLVSLVTKLTDSVVDIKDDMSNVKVFMTQVSSDVDILKAANKATIEYREARETREQESFKVYQAERQGTIEALKVLMQDRLIANADACFEKGYYTREERVTFHQMYELYISEPFNDGNPIVKELAPKLRALPMTKEEAEKDDDLGNRLKSLIKP